MTDITNNNEQRPGAEAPLDVEGNISYSKSIEVLHAELLKAAENDQAKVPGLVQQIKQIAPDDSLAPTNENGLTPLHLIVRTDVNESALSVLSSKMKPLELNLFDGYGNTAVHVAARRGLVNVIQTLITAGADPFIQNKASSRTALHISCEDGRNEIVNFLQGYAVKHSKSLDIQDEDGMTLLHVACQQGQNEIVSILLSGIENRTHPGGPSLPKPNIDINKQDNDGWTPLMYAAAYDNYEIFRTLLEHEADVNKKTRAGDTILMKAADWKEESTVKLLLKYNADIDLEDGDGRTALIYAAQSGRDDVVKVLLEKHANINHRTTSGKNALMIAMEWGHRSIVKLLLEKDADAAISNTEKSDLLFWASKEGLDYIIELFLKKLPPEVMVATDSEGNTALHIASGSEPSEDFSDGTDTPYQYDKTMSLLLDVPDIADMQTPEGDTALHLATRANKPRRVQILVNKMNSEVINRGNRFGETAFEIAVVNGYREIVLILLQEEVGLQPEPDIMEEAWTWAIESESNHDIAKMLIKRRVSNPEKRDGIHEKWDVLELAVYCEDLPAVWQLLQVIAPADRDRERIKRAKALADEMIKKGSKSRQKTTTRLDRWTGEKTTDATLPFHVINQLLEDIDDYLGISISVARLQRPIPKEKPDDPSIAENNVTITDFYTIDDSLASRREKTSVKEVVYGLGPEKIMAQKRDRRVKIKSEVERIKRTYKNSKMKEKEKAKGTDEIPLESTEEVRFRWIHLPANNLRWMEDLTMKVFYDRAQRDPTRYEKHEDHRDIHQQEFGQVNSFMKRSWVEVPDGGSSSRFMKPQCIKNNVETIVLPNPVRPVAEPTMESNQASKSNAYEDKPTQNFKHMALYMPYLTFGIQKPEEGESSGQKHDYIIHHSQTLDEFYYQFKSGNKLSQEQVNERNKDQIITKWLYDGKPQDLKAWVLLKVDQLWLWIITSDIIITSSTNRDDGRDDVVYREVFDILKSAARQPGSTRDLAELIVKACIHTYDRVPLVKGDNEIQAFKNLGTPLPAAHRQSVTIHEIFSNSINDSAIEEARLFEKFTDGEDADKETSDYGVVIEKPAKLLCKVKDLRDELHIIHTVVSYQQGVLEDLCSRRVVSNQEGGVEELYSKTPYKIPKAAIRILHKIEEMDKYVERLYDAVNATLTLRQNKLAIKHSDEAVKQGKTLMAFTIATVLFLPLSFLTSLFALNISSFQHDNQGELSYSSEWIFPLIFGVSIAAWILIGWCALGVNTLGYWRKHGNDKKADDKQADNKKIDDEKADAKQGDAKQTGDNNADNEPSDSSGDGSNQPSGARPWFSKRLDTAIGVIRRKPKGRTSPV